MTTGADLEVGAPNGRLSTLTNKDDQGSVLSRYLDMQYRGTGDLAHVEAQVPGHSDHTGTTDFTYDLRRQLVREVSTRHSPELVDQFLSVLSECLPSVASAELTLGDPRFFVRLELMAAIKKLQAEYNKHWITPLPADPWGNSQCISLQKAIEKLQVAPGRVNKGTRDM